MRQKIDYKNFCSKALIILEEIHKLINEFNKFELSKPVKTEVDEIIELSGKIRELKEPYRDLLSDYMKDIRQIDDDLREIDMVTSKLITEVNELPKEHKEDWFRKLGIEDIPKEFEGLSEDLQEKLNEMLDLTNEIIEETGKYFSLDKEDYFDYEDEVKKD